MEQLQISPATVRRMPPPFRLGTAAAPTPPRPALAEREPIASHVSAGDMPTIVQSILDCIQIGAMAVSAGLRVSFANRAAVRECSRHALLRIEDARVAVLALRSEADHARMTLVHEAFHVYQAQHGGNGYIHEALEAQVGGIVDSGNRNAAYNWLPALRSGKPFDEWNPEQQAELIETMARARSQSADTDRTKPGLESYDLDHDGQIDRNEMDLAAGDTDHDGHIDTAETADLDRDGMIDDTDGDGRIDTGETAVTLTEDEFQRLMAIADALKADRPDRTLV